MAAHTVPLHGTPQHRDRADEEAVAVQTKIGCDGLACIVTVGLVKYLSREVENHATPSPFDQRDDENFRGVPGSCRRGEAGDSAADRSIPIACEQERADLLELSPA